MATCIFRALASLPAGPAATLRLAAVASPLRAHTAALHATRMQFSDSAGGYDDAPSEKQVRYAQQLAQRSGLALPPDALIDRDRCSAFIDEALGKSEPSARQISFAESLAATKNEALPAEVRGSAKAISEYIDQNMHLAMGAAGGRGQYNGTADPRLPTDKQLLYAAVLARQKRVGLSFEQLSDRQTLSRFIDEVRGAGGANGGVYDPANYQANMAGDGGGGLAAGMAAGMGSSALGAAAGAAMVGGDGSPIDDQMLSAAERSGSGGAAPAGDAELDAEMDDLFGPNPTEGEEDVPLFKEGQIPF